jgi:hypothetical protein
MKIYIKDIEFPITILRKKSELEKGLKGKNFIDGCYLFMLQDDESHSFWMKDCLVPLDIIFCDNNQIVKIFHDCPPCNENNCQHYSHPGNVVLELAGGTCNQNGISEGDTFDISL